MIHHGTTGILEPSRGASYLNIDSRDLSEVSGRVKTLEPKESGYKTYLWGYLLNVLWVPKRKW